MAGEAAEGCRRRGGRRRAAGASSAPPESTHPSSSTVDASSIETGRLRALLATPGFSERVEFVNASDDVIRQLFVTERIADRAGGDLLMPPPAHRRTFKQIKDWFEMGNGQRREAAAAAADVKIIHSHDDKTIYWNGAWRERPPCSGISRSLIYGLGGRY